MAGRWYERAYRRNVVDMHIADWDEGFLSRFDPEKYVRMLVLSRVKSAVVYAVSHVGLCYYPTRVGRMHRGLKGRDILGEVVDLCHREGISVVVYYSLIYNGWAYDNRPDWRIIDAEGREAAEKSRYGVCCPNSPYRDFAKKQVEEICLGYEFEGMRFDMTFWPAVCYCPSCLRRYSAEVGGEPPRVVDWHDPAWVSFQRKREEWLVDLARLATSTVKGVRPDVSVEHQASTYTASWVLGVTTSLSEQNDFLQGDFYGDALQGSFICKLLQNLTENKPYGFETSSNISLGDHTTLKPKELLRAKAYAALANGGAFVFIDAVDPIGTLNPRVYRLMGQVFAETEVYESYLGGEPCQDVAVYFSTESKFDFADNGKRVKEASGRMPHLDAALSVAKAFITNHVPYGVVTKRNVRELSNYRLVVLPNVLMMDEEEAEAFRKYVRHGGALYASKYTSLTAKDGRRRDDFMLADLFGTSYEGETLESFTYVAPTIEGRAVFKGYSRRYPLSVHGSQLKVKKHRVAEVLGETVLPYSDPKDCTRYASIHSNPPGVSTGYPAVVLNDYGRGKVVYVTGDLESIEAHHDVFIRMIRLLASKPFFLESDAPKSVEVTAFHQRDKGRYVINMLNFQKELPSIPVDGIRVRVRLGSREAERLVRLPGGKEIEYRVLEDGVEFTAPRLETFMMVALDYS